LKFKRYNKRATSLRSESISDLVNAIISEQQNTIEQLEQYISG